MSTPAPEPSSVLRFDLAIQRNHLLVYLIVLVTALVARALGGLPLSLGVAFLLWGIATGCALIIYALFRRGVDRRLLNPVWIASDIVLLTLAIYLTGGISSPCFIWYCATASAAAFASGRMAAWVASAANFVAYLGVLFWMKQIAFFDPAFGLALTRMLFVFGASYFFLRGIADLSEKRLRIRQLESEARAKAQELAEANRRIQEADKLKSQFLANMSHELRTPMNSIIGFSEILVDRLGGKIEPKHLGFLDHIRTSGTHLLGIINDVLDLSKIEAGKMEIYPEFFSIAPVIESVCQTMRGMTRATQTIVVDVPQDLPQIETDLAKFKQVLFNLLSNAVKFSPPDKAIRVQATLDDGSITVAVQDEGIGIDPANHLLIFEEFRQVDGTVRREFGGTGLGLALVRRFVELQGGRVSVESKLDTGSTFTFTLPVRSRAAVVTRTPEVAAPAGRVLVVEDDANAFELIASALGSAGYFAIRARHGDEAIRLAKDSRPAAVTLDLVLPGIDGWEVLKRLKNDDATRQLPVVIISMVDNRDLGLALGADDYFVKPVDRARLLDRLRELTARGGKRLLVIDDDATVHALLDEDLSVLGYAIDKAFSGEDGLRFAEERSPDVIILDLMMPGMNGFEVAGSLKQNPRTANIPIVILTSKDISKDDRALLHTKVSSFVQKGTSAQEQLVREIRRVTAAPPAPSA